MGEHPVQHRGERVRRALGHRLVDELPLPALALRRDDHPPRDAVDHGAAQLAPDQVQAGVDPGGGAGAGDEVAVVDVEDVRVDLDLRVAGAQLVDAVPVRGDLPAVQDPGLGQHEHPRAHAEHHRPVRLRVPQGLEGLLGELAHPGGGDGDEVGAAQAVEPVPRDDVDTAGRADRPAGLRSAHPEVEHGQPVVGAVQAEDLAQHPELEDRELG